MSAPLPMETTTLDEQGRIVSLRPLGPIRAQAGVAFKSEIERLVGEVRCLILDLSQVDHVESSALGFLLNVHDGLRSGGGKLALAAVSNPVRLILDSIGLTSFFSVYETVEAALAALRDSEEGPLGLE